MENNFNLESAIASIERVKEMKARETRPSTSIKPLKFEVSPNDSPLKQLLIRKINEKKLTYSDLHQYCTQVKGGDINEGKNFGYNLITGLRKRPTMTDVTFQILCDFLDLDIILRDRSTEEETSNREGD